jgi:hypothetical protein
VVVELVACINNIINVELLVGLCLVNNNLFICGYLLILNEF